MTSPLILPFYDILPRFAGPISRAGAGAVVIGRTTIGTDVFLGADSVIRGDGNEVHIGDGVWLGTRATVHIVHDILPAIIGSNTTVGDNSIVHACTVGANCLLEDDVTVLDGAVVEDNVLIEAGSTVFPRKILKSGSVYGGSPALPIRELRAGELAERAMALRARRTSVAVRAGALPDFGDAVFIARNSQCAGELHFAPGSSLFFSCVADAGTGSITVCDNTNVQDNTIMRAGSGALAIGRDTTVGHNVRMGAVRIGAEALIGMGAVLSDGTVIEDDVLLAAGSTTAPGQVLESGWLWGGRPARPLSKLDAARRENMAENILTYCDYSQAYRRSQQELV
jgi:carbonic anhydrase/acetyltransferase-like protein (isoleucine patch superfamily)